MSDVALGSGIRDEADFSVFITDSSDCRHLCSQLLDGSAQRFFERIFENSSRSIVGLTQIVLCADTFSKSSWVSGLAPGKIYEAK